MTELLVVGINGSPKKRVEKSGTHFLIERALAGAQREGAATELVDLSAYELTLCTGCEVCLKGTCPEDEKDDMPKIEEKLLAAHGLIIGSPSYFGGPTGLMKTLIDRSRDLKMPESKLAGKVIGFVATSGLRVGGQETVFHTLSAFALGHGMIIVGGVGNPWYNAPMAAGTMQYDVDGKPKFRPIRDDLISAQDAGFLGSRVAVVARKLMQGGN